MSAKPTVIVVGGGYAGLFGLGQLSARREKLNLVLVDRKPSSENLPMLPDIVGRRVQADNLRFDLHHFARNHGARFCRAAVASMDIEKRALTFMNGKTLSGDYLLVCTGTETNFYGRDDLAAAVPRMDTVADAQQIGRRVDADDFSSVVVVGGGYTGVELVTNVHRRLKVRGTLAGKTLHLVELADSILPGLDEGVRRYCLRNMERMGIVIHTGTTLEAFENKQASLANGETIAHCLAAWSAGIHTSACVRTLAQERPQGRLKVAPTLLFADRCYAAGDAAGLERAGRMLRPAVQFAIAEGRAAARNILRDIAGKQPEPSEPRDLGWVVPMGNFRGCGRAMGVPVHGRKAMLLHYFMCVFQIGRAHV